MRREKALRFAKKQGYVGAEYKGKWKGADIYEAINDEGRKPESIGIPDFILDEGIGFRMVVGEESLDYIGSLPEEA